MTTGSSGRTVDLGNVCQARTRRGIGCSRAATTWLDGLIVCDQHAASYRSPGISHCSVLDARRKSLEILHVSDLHGKQRATRTALRSCEDGRNSAVVIITGDVGSISRPHLDPGWSRITPRERWTTPGNHEADRDAVFKDARGWLWSCPWIRIIGRFAIVGFDSGPETRGVISRDEVDLVFDRVNEVWEHDDRRALVIASHHKPDGRIQAQMNRRLSGLLPEDRPVVLLYGHEHGSGLWEEGQLGRFRTWTSRISSCDKDPVGHRITLTAGEPMVEEIR